MKTSILGTILDIFGIGAKALEKKQERKLKEIESKTRIKEAEAEAEINHVKKTSENRFSLDMIAMRNMRKTFKDEYLTFILTFPLLMCCITPFIMCYRLGWDKLLENTIESYRALNTLPIWQQYSIIGIIIVTFGLRTLFVALFNRK